MTNHVELIKAAIADKELDHVYFNGFSLTVGTADVLFVLKEEDTPVLILHTSHIVAKTLIAKLSPILSKFEDDVGQSIMLTDEINAKINPEVNDESIS